MTPYYERGPVKLYHADCLEWLPTLPAGSLDAVVTDPPYSSGGMVRGDRMAATNMKYSGWGGGGIPISEKSEHTFTGDNRDQRSFAHWCALWYGAAIRAAKHGAHCLAFTDWRQLPSVTDSVQAGGWIWRGIVVWDKGIARPMKGRFRNHAEYIVWGSSGPINGDDNPVYLDGVYRITPPSSDDRQHLTEKPSELIEQVLAIAPPTALVCDPFFGSGTTAVACVRTGRGFIGCEISEEYCETAAKRCDKELDQGRLFDATSAVVETQNALFAETSA